MFPASAAPLHQECLAAVVAHVSFDRGVAMKAERLVVITHYEPALATFRAVQRPLELLGDVFRFFIPVRPFRVCPPVQTVLCESITLAVFKDASVDVAEYWSVNVAFELPPKLELNEIQNKLQRCCDDGLVFCFVVVIPAMLDAVPHR